MKLRSYQEGALCKARQSMQQGHQRPLLMAPTGAGKTAIAIALIKLALAKGKRVLFTVDRLQLINQTSEVFYKAGLDHGIIQGFGWRENTRAPLQLASVQTLIRRDHHKLMDFDLIINDEAHVVYKGMTDRMNTKWKDTKVLGLSATPFTKGLGLIYDDLIVVETTENLINEGYLCDFDAWGASEIDLKGVRTLAGEYNQKQLGEKVNKTKIIGDIVKTWFDKGENRQTLCFAVNVAHSKAIVAEFIAKGVPAEHMDSHTDEDERELILKRYESGETKILSNCGITTKGFDSPNTSCLILGRPTKSLMLHIQMLGRVLRMGEDRSKAIILDHGGNIGRLGFPTDELPQYLCNGELEVKTDSKDGEEKEEKETLPTNCEKCNHLSTEFVCPSCGHVPIRSPNIESTDEKLKKLKRKGQDMAVSDKHRWFGELLGHARSKGFQDGWASHKYKEKFGVFPHKKVGIVPIRPSEEILGFIKHLQIKNARRNRA